MIGQTLKHFNWTFDRGAIAAQVLGQGPAVVLLHGFGGKPGDWAKIAQFLSQNHTVVIPNLHQLYLGTDHFSFREQVEITARLIEALHQSFGVLDLIGTSYGGSLAAALRTYCPAHFRSVILVNPMPPNPAKRTTTSHLGWLLRIAKNPFLLSIYLGSPLGKRTLTTLTRSIRPDLHQRFRRFQLFLNRRQKFIFHIVQRFSKIIMEVDWRHWEREMSADGPEILLVYSLEDQIFGAKSSDWWRENLLNSESLELKVGRHMAIVTHPVEIKEMIAEFITNTNEQVRKKIS